MKWRQEQEKIPESVERELESELRALDAGSGPVPPVPGPYWQNLIVRTNKRIDAVSSGRGITISWAARVAIPGVVAVISFLIGLHYYAPETGSPTDSVLTIIAALPDRAVDSLLADRVLLGGEPPAKDLAGEKAFEVSEEQFSEYFIAQGSSQKLLESLDEKGVSQVMAYLAVR
jgi:hypothetical protein